MLIMNKSQKNGFTLVEVIVVAVIVLILSAVAIPMYNGYVRGARQDTVDNLAETAAAAANNYWRKTDNSVTNADLVPNSNKLNLHYDDKKHTVTVNGASIRVEDKHGNFSVVRYRAGN